MRKIMITFAAAFAGNMLAGVSAQEARAQSPASAQTAQQQTLTPEAVNEARIETLLEPAAAVSSEEPDPVVARLQVLLDREGASPGVIDGYMGENVRKALRAFEHMQGLQPDGELDPDLVAALEARGAVLTRYTITEEDVSDIVPPIPDDFSEMAEREFLGYESVAEKLAERFHMDIDLLETLNPGSDFAPGETINVADYGVNREGEVARIEADKALRQVRAYDADGRLLAAYPATIGSRENPSPSGTHEVVAIAPMPNYTYNPENFQQGDNTEVLILPPGPNGPVGSMWIDLSKPSYGIHGAPDPALIDKVASQGCVRLTNWDAEELAGMVAAGVTVEFLEE